MGELTGTGRLGLLATFAAAALLAPSAAAPADAQTRAPAIFPSNSLTVRDTTQATGRRVKLRLPDCRRLVSNCNEIRLLNQLDGFDTEPRVEIRFHRPIDVAKVNGQTIYVQAKGGPRIALNRLVWSPARNALYGIPERQLEEARTYTLRVSRQLSGRGASTSFTTMSATAGLVQMRKQLDDGSAYDAAGIAPADRRLRFERPNGERTVFAAANVRNIVRFDDTGEGPLAESQVLNTALENAGTYAFGSFAAPSWLTADRVIPARPTRGAGPRARGKEEIGFTLIAPAGQKPEGGWPVAIFGPGITRSKYDLFLAADRNAARGIATVAIDPVGHAFGPRSEVAVETTVPPATRRFSGFGRGRDTDRNGRITDQEGVSALGQPHKYAAVALRDGLRQTALDNMTLVRAIASGADIDGDGSSDLRPTGITYYAQSLGGIYGTMLMGVDPKVEVGALNVPGGPILEIARLAPGFRRLVAEELRNRRPPLTNGGRDGFTESTPLRADPPVLAPARGAVPIQSVGSRAIWLERPGSPEAFAPLLRRRPLADSAPKRVLYQFAFGDQTVPNPTSATLVRAGDLADVTSVYRNDRSPTASTNPHGFLLDPRLAGRNLGQMQILEFLASDGRSIIDPDGAAGLFETPVSDLGILESLNYSLPPAQGEPPPEEPRRPASR